jgi:hypothetical protein
MAAVMVGVGLAVIDAWLAMSMGSLWEVGQRTGWRDYSVRGHPWTSGAV